MDLLEAETSFLKKVNRIRYRKKNFRKFKARKLTQKLVRFGFLVKPKRCEVCLVKCKVQAHHMNYEDPEFVMWVCETCHKEQHSSLNLIA